MALTELWSSLLLLRLKPAGASPGTIFRGCDVPQQRELWFLSIVYVNMPCLAFLLPSPPPGAAFAVLRWAQRRPSDDLSFGYLSWDYILIPLRRCHPIDAPACALQSSSQSRCVPQVPACRAGVKEGEEWAMVRLVTEQISSFISLMAWFGAMQKCGFSSCQQRFCWVVVVFTARWMKMAPLRDQDNYLGFPLLVWGVCISIPRLQLVQVDVISPSDSMSLSHTGVGKAVLLSCWLCAKGFCHVKKG